MCSRISPPSALTVTGAGAKSDVCQFLVVDRRRSMSFLLLHDVAIMLTISISHTRVPEWERKLAYRPSIVVLEFPPSTVVREFRNRLEDRNADARVIGGDDAEVKRSKVKVTG